MRVVSWSRLETLASSHEPLGLEQCVPSLVTTNPFPTASWFIPRSCCCQSNSIYLAIHIVTAALAVTILPITVPYSLSIYTPHTFKIPLVHTTHSHVYYHARPLYDMHPHSTDIAARASRILDCGTPTVLLTFYE